MSYVRKPGAFGCRVFALEAPMDIKVAELPPLIKASAAYRLLGISRDTARHMIADGRLPQQIVVSERVRLFDTAELLACIRASREDPENRAA